MNIPYFHDLAARLSGASIAKPLPNQLKKCGGGIKSSQYVGVCLRKNGKNAENSDFQVAVRFNGRKIYAPYFRTEYEAALAYDLGKLYYCGLESPVNFPENMPKYIDWLKQINSRDDLVRVVDSFIRVPHPRRNAATKKRGKKHD